MQHSLWVVLPPCGAGALRLTMARHAGWSGLATGCYFRELSGREVTLLRRIHAPLCLPLRPCYWQYSVLLLLWLLLTAT
jgi:hypothetical protein